MTTFMDTTNNLVRGFTVLTLAFAMGCGQDSGFTPQVFEKTGCLENCTNNVPEDGEPNEDYGPLPDFGFQAAHTDSNLAATINKKEESLTLHLPLTSFFNLGEVVGESVQLPGVHFKSVLNPDGSYNIVLEVPLKYLVKNMDWLAPARLPNGDPLPAIPDGELPSITLGLVKSGNLNVHLYLGYGMAAIFVTTPFDPAPSGRSLQYPIKDSQQQSTVGYLVAVPEKGKHNGGFFMSTVLPDDVARALDKHFNIE